MAPIQEALMIVSNTRKSQQLEQSKAKQKPSYKTKRFPMAFWGEQERTHTHTSIKVGFQSAREKPRVRHTVTKAKL